MWTLIGNLNFQKIIAFHEITAVRRAKAVAVFPTAIEIMAGGKKVRTNFQCIFGALQIMIFCGYFIFFRKETESGGDVVEFYSFFCSTSSPLFYSVMKLLSSSVKVGCSTVMGLRKFKISRYLID